MQNNIDRIRAAIFQAIDEFNKHLLIEHRIDKSDDTILMGRKSVIDSMAMVNLIVAIEKYINKEFNANITLNDDKMLFMQESPFKTIRSFINYINTFITNYNI